MGLCVVGRPGGAQPPVNAVQGSTAVARTIPGRILPTGDPTPGNLSAAPNLLPTVVGGPSVTLKPGKPNSVPRAPGPTPKFGPTLPVNGNPTNGWPELKYVANTPVGAHCGQKGGRKTAVPANVPTLGPDGARIIAGPLPSRVLLKYP